MEFTCRLNILPVLIVTSVKNEIATRWNVTCGVHKNKKNKTVNKNNLFYGEDFYLLTICIYCNWKYHLLTFQVLSLSIEAMYSKGEAWRIRVKYLLACIRIRTYKYIEENSPSPPSRLRHAPVDLSWSVLCNPWLRHFL